MAGGRRRHQSYTGLCVLQENSSRGQAPGARAFLEGIPGRSKRLRGREGMANVPGASQVTLRGSRCDSARSRFPQGTHSRRFQRAQKHRHLERLPLLFSLCFPVVMFDTGKGTTRPFKTSFVFMLLHVVTGKSKPEVGANTVDFIPTLRAASESVPESYSIHSRPF